MCFKNLVLGLRQMHGDGWLIGIISGRYATWKVMNIQKTNIILRDDKSFLIHRREYLNTVLVVVYFPCTTLYVAWSTYCIGEYVLQLLRFIYNFFTGV